MCCQLQTDTCQGHCQRLNKKDFCHLHLQRLNPALLQLLTFSTPWGSSGWSGALCAPGTLLEYSQLFSETDFISQSLHFLLFKKVLNPFMMTSAPRERQKTSCKVGTWLHWTPSSQKSYILTFPDYIFGAISQSQSLPAPRRCCLPGFSPHFAPNKT